MAIEFLLAGVEGVESQGAAYSRGRSNQLTEQRPVMRPSGICVFWESVNRDTNDPHQISTLAGCQHGPHRKVVVHGCEYRLRVRPRILWIWTLVGKGRCEAFQIVGDRKDRANPVLEVCEPAERKEIRNPFLVIRERDPRTSGIEQSQRDSSAAYDQNAKSTPSQAFR